LAGAVLQRVLRNTLADPFVLGVTSGGTLFAVGAIILGAPFFYLGVPVRVLAALLGAGLTLILVLFANKFVFRGEGSYGVPLAGMLLNAFFGALLTFLLSVVDPGRLGESFRWLVGDIQPLSLKELGFVGVFLFLASFALLRLSTAIGALAFGDDFAISLGFPARRLRLLAIVLAALLTAIVVSFAGSVGFVGLVVPHAARWFVRGSLAREWLVSIFMGGILVLVADIFARVVLSPSEIPVGIFTALMGVPLLVVMALRKGAASDLGA
jgi:iron complex transport system permease protein